jgi:NADH-ubiquinone oxidoreductase chain 4
MLLLSLIIIPIFGILTILSFISYNNIKLLKSSALFFSILNLIISLIIWVLFDNSSKYFQFIQEHYIIGNYDFYLGIDGLSLYFILLTTIIMPISILSNWKSITEKTIYFLIIMLILESLLLLVFLVLDILMFYIFFESTLAPLFILIGIFGSSEKIRASFYFFLYTLLGSLFMLLSIITMLSLIGCTDFNILSKTNFSYITQLFIFIGIFIAFAVKTPTIYLNTWLLKAHVESPLSGSIILAAIVLKLSLYGVFRLILPLVPKAFIYYTYIVFLICVLTIIYASLSTLRTIDVKELIAYSSVSHAAVYLAGVFSNTLQGIQGGIGLGLAHGFVSSGLFICAGGVLYDRSGTRLITYYRGIAQIMPIFSILFFILCLGNCGAPLTLNFIGEFMSLYGVFERLPIAGALASSSIVLSAAYTIFMYNRIAYAGSFAMKFWNEYLPDINKREFVMLLTLVLFTVILGIYPSIILDGLHYYTYSLLFTFNSI